MLSLLLFGLMVVIDSFIINNRLIGEPKVKCGLKTVRIWFQTQNSFYGNVYVRNYSYEEKCKVTGQGYKGIEFEVNFDSCGVKMERSLDPRGVAVTTTVILSFHSTFETKVDRAISIRCFYMAAERTFTQQLDISMFTTIELRATQKQQVLPVCRYEILDGGPDGQPVRFTIVGQKIYHKWSCSTDTADAFCMVVFDCNVDDGAGNKIQLINSDGCAIDKYLLGNLVYTDDLTAAQECHVFKYADQPYIYFDCQIRVTPKKPGRQCLRPSCNGVYRKRRFIDTYADDIIQGVSTQGMTVSDMGLIKLEIISPILDGMENSGNSSTKNQTCCFGPVSISYVVYAIAIIVCIFIIVLFVIAMFII